MAQVLRWGILGAAKIARTELAPAMMLAADSDLVAVATKSGSAQALEAIRPGLRVHSDYQALLADPDVDAVYIPLPNDLHIPWSLKALAAGKHVLCEKPIALQADDIDRLIDARGQSGRLAAEAFMVVHHPQWRDVRALIAAGEIGELRHVQGHFSYNNQSDPDNFRNKAENGGGALRDIGVYPCVTTRFVTGREPTRVQAQVTFENGVDTMARVQADFDGFSCDFYCSMRLVRHQEMLFHGTKGLIRLTAPFNPVTFAAAELQLLHPDGSEDIRKYPGVMQYQRMIEAFRDSVLNGVEFACPLEFSRGNQVMIDSIFASATTG